MFLLVCLYFFHLRFVLCWKVQNVITDQNVRVLVDQVILLFQYLKQLAKNLLFANLKRSLRLHHWLRCELNHQAPRKRLGSLGTGHYCVAPSAQAV